MLVDCGVLRRKGTDCDDKGTGTILVAADGDEEFVFVPTPLEGVSVAEAGSFNEALVAVFWAYTPMLDKTNDHEKKRRNERKREPRMTTKECRKGGSSKEENKDRVASIL